MADWKSKLVKEPDEPSWKKSLDSSVDQNESVDKNEKGTANNPYESSVLTDKERMLLSFGDKKGMISAIKARGYTDVKENDNGDIIFKDEDGSWNTDATSFTRHPINWLESGYGKALPAGGGVIGGFVGGPMGALLGAGFGESARQAYGKSQGVYTGDTLDTAKDIALEGISNALGEKYGATAIKEAGRLASIPVNKASKWALGEEAGPILKRNLIKVQEVLSGIPRDVLEMFSKNPEEVERYINNNQARYTAAQNFRREMLNAKASAAKEVGEQKGLEKSLYGDLKQDTSEAVSELKRRYPDSNAGKILQKEQEWVTPVETQMVDYGVPEEQIIKSIPEKVIEEKSPKPRLPKGKWGSLKEYAEAVANKAKEHSEVYDPYLRDAARQARKEGVQNFGILGEPIEAEVPTMVTAKQPKIVQSGPVQTELKNELSIEELLGLSKQLNDELPYNRFDPRIGVSIKPSDIGIKKGQLGQVKKLLHKASPGLASADEFMHKLAKNLKPINRSLKEEGVEGFVNQLQNPSKTSNLEMLKNIEGMLPGTTGDILNASTAREMEKYTNARNYRNLVRRGLIGAGSLAAFDSVRNSDNSMVQTLSTLALLPAIASSPSATKWSHKLLKNLPNSSMRWALPAEAEGVQYGVDKAIRSVWEDMNKNKKENKQ